MSERIIETIRVLSDDPTEKDSFGSHDAIAKALADLIETEPQSRAVALTGSWGCGKSSVIAMLREKLGKDDILVVFDAWAHQGDPLKRSFLEYLIVFLMKEELIDESKWAEEVDRLSRRQETTQNTTYSKPSRLGIALAISALVSPFGFTALSQWSEALVTCPPNSNPV